MKGSEVGVTVGASVESVNPPSSSHVNGSEVGVTVESSEEIVNPPSSSQVEGSVLVDVSKVLGISRLNGFVNTASQTLL